MNEDQPECEYARVRISGTLICTSDLHVGDGDLGLFSDRPSDRQRSVNEAGSYNTVCLDHNKRAYIPGSTLRGSLAAFLNKDHATVEKLFGYEESAGENRDGKRLAGKVRVFDAHIAKSIDTDGDKPPYWNPQSGTFISHGIALDDVTGTAEKGKLFRYELVPAGTQFAVKVEADHLTKAEIAKLLGLLARWNGSSQTAIGKGTSKGYGRIEWKYPQVSVLTTNALQQWAASNTLNAPHFEPAAFLPGDVAGLFKQQEREQEPERKRHEFVIRILPQSPLLCNEPGFVTGADQAPDLVFQARNGKAIIPGTTLAGAARARGRKILMTLLHQAKPDAKLNDIAEQAGALIKQLFGSEKQKSALEFSDATDTATETTEHPQYFNAIDRFTGGVKDGALFNVIAAQCDALETEPCSLNHDRMPEDGNWWKGLLLFIVRDAIEGELAIGWGKGKGYGSFTVAIECQGHSISNTDDLINAIASQFGKNEVGIWIKALSDEINTRIQIEGVVA
jgi:CRISPR/Cas system CSM-associated protein Csm3 (group 7 of RAMP superfamily)